MQNIYIIQFSRRKGKYTNVHNYWVQNKKEIVIDIYI